MTSSRGKILTEEHGVRVEPVRSSVGKDGVGWEKVVFERKQM